MKKSKILVPQLVAVVCPMIIGTGSVFGSYITFLFKNKIVIIDEKSSPESANQKVFYCKTNKMTFQKKLFVNAVMEKTTEAQNKNNIFFHFPIITQLYSEIMVGIFHICKFITIPI